MDFVIDSTGEHIIPQKRTPHQIPNQLKVTPTVFELYNRNVPQASDNVDKLPAKPEYEPQKQLEGDLSNVVGYQGSKIANGSLILS
jgi:hypothetical protein